MNNNNKKDNKKLNSYILNILFKQLKQLNKTMMVIVI
jgi:hypothetical protein